MADEDQDDSQKTEDPTQKRLDDALKKGQVANSREVTSFLMLVVFAIALVWLVPPMMKETLYNLSGFISKPHEYSLDSQSMTAISSSLLSSVLFLMIPLIAILVIVIYLSSIIQHPIIFAGNSIAPKMEGLRQDVSRW
jgi:flagellar biosynthetic protein FlhB